MSTNLYNYIFVKKGGLKMKAIRIENDKVVAYVHKRDIEILRSISELIDPDLFEEDSIKNDECDDNGYYRITNESNIRYIKGIKFIPNYDFLSQMDYCTLNELQQRYGIFSRTVNTIFSQKGRLEAEDIEFLKTLPSINAKDLVLLDADCTEEEALALKYAIRQELRCYSYSIREMIHQKLAEERREEEARKAERKNVLQKVLERVKKPSVSQDR